MRLWWRDEMHRHRGRAVHGCFGDWLASTISSSRSIQNGYIYISVLIGSIDEDLQTMIVTGLVPVPPIGFAGSKMGTETIELLAVMGLPDVNPAPERGLLLPERIWNG